MEHLPDYPVVLRRLQRLLKPGGRVYRRFPLYLWASAAAFRSRGMKAYRVLLERPQAA